MLLPLSRLTLDFPTLLLTIVLGIFFVYRLAKLFGGELLSFAALGVLIVQAQWGLAQFVVQRDLGMYLIGESIIGREAPAVAKFTSFDTKFIRAYGPYAHANSFGGAMVVGMVLTGMLLRSQRRNMSSVHIFWLATVAVLLLGGLISFSRAAYIGLIIAALSIWHFGVRLKWFPLVSLIGVLVFMPLIYGRLIDKEDRGISERVLQWEAWRSIVKQHKWWRGTGVGRYAVVLERSWLEAGHIYEPWEVAPVHSVPLLLVAEWGWGLGLAGVAALFWAGLRVGVMAAALLPVLAFDHYFVTQLGMLAWLVTLIALWVVARRQRQSPQ